MTYTFRIVLENFLIRYYLCFSVFQKAILGSFGFFGAIFFCISERAFFGSVSYLFVHMKNWLILLHFGQEEYFSDFSFFYWVLKIFPTETSSGVGLIPFLKQWSSKIFISKLALDFAVTSVDWPHPFSNKHAYLLFYASLCFLRSYSSTATAIWSMEMEWSRFFKCIFYSLTIKCLGRSRRINHFQILMILRPWFFAMC